MAQPAASPAAPAPASAPSAPGDEYWAAGYHLPGMDLYVNALVFGPDGSLYAGGNFGTADRTAANRIARWDGSQWHPLNIGMNDRVNALAVGLDGTLYAGGWFTTAGGVATNYIARWDGSAWHPLGSGMVNSTCSWCGAPVYALAVGPDGSLYAGGEFDTAGDVSANNIARWDPSTSSWHPLDSGTTDSVYALAVGPDGTLYAGGEFHWAGGVPATRIARWDGTAWYPLGTGIRQLRARPLAWIGWHALCRRRLHDCRWPGGQSYCEMGWHVMVPAGRRTGQASHGFDCWPRRLTVRRG